MFAYGVPPARVMPLGAAEALLLAGLGTAVGSAPATPSCTVVVAGAPLLTLRRLTRTDVPSTLRVVE